VSHQDQFQSLVAVHVFRFSGISGSVGFILRFFRVGCDMFFVMHSFNMHCLF